MKSTNTTPKLIQWEVLSALPSSGTYPYFFLQLIFIQHTLSWTGEADAILHGSVVGSVEYHQYLSSKPPAPCTLP